MKKVLEKMKKMSSVRLLIYIGVALILIGGSSYAYLIFLFEGNETNLVQAGCFDVSFKENNVINLTDQVPITDEEGKTLTPYTFTIENTCEIDAYFEATFNTLTTSAIENDSKVKVYVTGATEQNPTLLKYLKKVELEKKPSDVQKSYLVDSGVLSVGETKTYNLTMWIDYDATSFDGTFAGKVLVTAVNASGNTGSLVKDREANAPELATNMIPVYYNGSNWVKADVNNINEAHTWYNYENKQWANAVTVLSANRTKYLNADPGTTIAMDDINTMWVWIPRFMATEQGALCSTLSNPTTQKNFSCYDKGKVDITEEDKEKMITGMYLFFLLQGASYTEEDIRTMMETAIAENDTATIEQGIQMYASVLMLQHLSSYVTLSDTDKTAIYTLIGDQTMADTFIDNGFSFMLLYMLIESGAADTISSDIIIPQNDEVFGILCEKENISSAQCNLVIQQMNSQYSSMEKLQMAMMLNEQYPEIQEHFTIKATDIVYELNFNGNNKTGGYNGGTKENPGAFNITFTGPNDEAHDAFTFGDKELNGIWVGKFETSHISLEQSNSTTNNLSCTNEKCSGARGLNILPNKVALRYQNVSNMFYAARSIEQLGNSYGLVSNEIDTHMMKNSEWGAVAYLTQSIYGRCTSSTSCTEMGINNNSSYITGYGAPAETSQNSNNGTYETSLGMDASTTGNIYGVYDMSGGAYEYVMGVYTDGSTISTGSSGFTSMPENKYFDSYTAEGDGYQHALTETAGWYTGESSSFVSSDYPWFTRGGYYSGNYSASIFYYGTNSGSYYGSGGFRAVLVK